MKVLFIAPAYPVPAHSGGAIATLETLRSIHRLCELHLMVPPAPDNAAHQALLSQLPGVTVHFYQPRKERQARFEIFATAIKSLLTRQSYWVWIWSNKDLRASVRRLTRQHPFDVVHCEWLETSIAVRGLNLPLVIRMLDVHFVIMRDTVEGRPPGHKLRKSFWRLQARRFRRFEAATLNDASAVVTLSAEDEAVLRGEGVSNIVTIPPPRKVDPVAPQPSTMDAKCTALFVGRLDMVQNREAFFVFADKVWPHVSDRCRERVKIVFAGGFPDEEVRRRASELGFKLHAPLSDTEASRLFAEAGIFLSPVISGTGIKIKTLEAMAHGKPIVGFLGAFRGVPLENNKHALVADSPEDFARLLERLVFDPALRSHLGHAAHDFVRVTFDPGALGVRLISVYSRVTESRGRGQQSAPRA